MPDEIAVQAVKRAANELKGPANKAAALVRQAIEKGAQKAEGVLETVTRQVFGKDGAVVANGARAGVMPANAAGGLAEAKATPAGKFVLRIAHANDTHSALDLAPRMKTLMEEVQKADPHVLKIHAGDLLVGTPWYEVGGKGVADFKAMENQGFEVFVIGNHDLDSGVANLVKAMKHTKADVVVANWEVTGDLAKRVKPYVIKDVDGRKVAVVGISIDPAAYGNATPEIVYQDPVEALKKLIPELKGKVDAIVLASHVGNTVDQQIAGYFPEINAIIGGHSHTVVPFPKDFTHPDFTENLVTQAGASSKYLGLMELDIENGVVVKNTGSLLPLHAEIPEHPEMVELLKPYAAKLKPFTEVIGQASNVISARSSSSLDSKLGNLVTDAMRQGAEKHLKKLPGADAPGAGRIDIAIFNATGLRAGIPKGEITMGTMYKVFPFDNTMAITELTGKQVQEMLDHAAYRGGDPISGVTFAIDRRKATNVLINGKPLNPNKTYRVAANSYMVEKGGSGYEVLTQGKKTIKTDLSIRDMLTEFFREQGAIKVPQKAEQRTTALSGEALGDVIRKKLGILRGEEHPEVESLEGIVGKP